MWYACDGEDATAANGTWEETETTITLKMPSFPLPVDVVNVVQNETTGQINGSVNPMPIPGTLFTTIYTIANGGWPQELFPPGLLDLEEVDVDVEFEDAS
jgi:hypothetical protein